jgi:hypothetical protein
MSQLKRTKRIMYQCQPTLTDMPSDIIEEIVFCFMNNHKSKIGNNSKYVIDKKTSFLYTAANSLIIILTSVEYPDKYLSDTTLNLLKVLHLRLVAHSTGKTIRKSIIHSHYYTSIRKLIQFATNNEAVRQHMLTKFINKYKDSTDHSVSAIVAEKTMLRKKDEENKLYLTINELYKGLAFTCHQASRRGTFRKDILLYFEKEMKSMYETLPVELRKKFEYSMLVMNAEAIMVFKYQLPNVYLVKEFINLNKKFPFLNDSDSIAYKIKDDHLKLPHIAVKVCDIQVVPVITTIYYTQEDVQNSQNNIEDYYIVGDSYCLKKELKVTIKPIKVNSISYKYYITLQISVIALNHILLNTNWKSIVVNNMGMITTHFIHRDKPDIQLLEYPGNIPRLISYLKTNHTRIETNIIVKPEIIE